MSARTAAWIGIGVYLIITSVLLLVVGRLFGVGWEIGLTPVEMIGGMALGALAAKAGTS
jgi:hypothetical protein